MRNQKGVTLIALIVTIIVLIIIAGISIASLTGDNGILRQVDTAKVTNIEGQANEEFNLSCAAVRVAIANKQASDNSYSAFAGADDVSENLLAAIKADTQLKEDGWAIDGEVTTDADNAKATFNIVYSGDDYKQACDNENAKITYTVTLGRSSITFKGDAGTSNSRDSISLNDIGAGDEDGDGAQ